jgi:D-3-phosphoglycerate dehydrogenase / 2-oxoglutarate reductase
MSDQARPTVLLTDFAWPDIGIERNLIEGAGFRLAVAEREGAEPLELERQVREHQPAAILTCWARVSADAIAASRNLKIVARLGIGLDNIDVQAATASGIWVTNVPDYCVEEVSDHAVAMVLAWTRGIVALDKDVRRGLWMPAEAKLRRLSNLKCGIVGYGRIGRRTATKLTHGFGAKVAAFDPYPLTGDEHVQQVSLEQLLGQSDVVILHAPLTPETRHLMNRARFQSMKHGALLVNVSRGALVDTGALLEVLDGGRLGAAALDVLETEPNVPAALLQHPNVILTPHVAFTSDAALVALRRGACEEVVRVLSGDAPNEARNIPLQGARDQ